MRPTINTTYTRRTQPTTVYSKPRDSATFLWSAETQPWDAGFFPWQFTNEGISTSWTPRNTITTEYRKPRVIGDLWTAENLVWEATFFPWQYTGMDITEYSTPRYAKYVEDTTGNNIFDLSGNRVQGISGNRTNIIDTFYT